MTDTVFFQGRWLHGVEIIGMTCEQHPSEPWPHPVDGRPCSGPGCPATHQRQTLTQALEFIRTEAAGGSFRAAEWLDGRGIDWTRPDGVIDAGGPY